MGELDEAHRAQMTEHGVGAGLGIAASLSGGGVEDAPRNELEHLPKNIEMVTCWLGGAMRC